MKQVEESLVLKTGIGGVARYEGDTYQLVAGAAGIPGNPWVVCTLWLAQYRIARALDLPSLGSAIPPLEWAARRARASGVLPEQVHPYTGEYLSVSPLTWSHATFVATVLDFIEKADMLSRAQPHAGRTAQPTLAEKTAGARS
jgi:GH15 family glucan-1,4-alpha-glucosidase